MELKRLLAIAGLLALASSAPAQTPPSTVNPLIPIAGQPVEQSGPALRQNFLAAMNDINALYALNIANGRTKLTAPLTLFANFSTGNNANSCTAIGSPCKTVSGAYNKLVQNYDTAGQAVTISFANDDSAGLAINTAWSGGGQVTIQGPGGSPPTVGFTSAVGVSVQAPLPAQLNLVGFKVSGSTYGILFTSPGVISINNLNFGAEGVTQTSIQSSGSKLICAGPYTISGGAIAHWQAITGGSISCAGVTVTLTGTPAFSGIFAAADTLALIFAPNLTFTGSATGARYLSTNNSVIATAGGDNYFPGNAGGTVSNGGIYQ